MKSSLRSPEDGVIFDLDERIEHLRSLEPYEGEGRTARTLIHTDDLRVVLVVMKAGDRMKEHHIHVACHQCDKSFEVSAAVVAESQELLDVGCPGTDYEGPASVFAALVVHSPKAPR